MMNFMQLKPMYGQELGGVYQEAHTAKSYADIESFIDLYHDKMA